MCMEQSVRIAVHIIHSELRNTLLVWVRRDHLLFEPTIQFGTTSRSLITAIRCTVSISVVIIIAIITLIVASIRINCYSVYHLFESGWHHSRLFVVVMFINFTFVVPAS